MPEPGRWNERLRRLGRYLWAGVLTTLVSFGLLCLLESLTAWDENINNSLSVFCAVTFAYVVNKSYVFRSSCCGFRELFRQFCAFYAARGVTILLEIGGVWLLTRVWLMPVLTAKLVLNALVLLLNYLFSRQVIFR